MRYLTKKQIVRKNQLKAKNYLKYILEPLLLKKVQEYVDSDDMPYRFGYKDNEDMFAPILGSTLAEQSKNYNYKKQTS